MASETARWRCSRKESNAAAGDPSTPVLPALGMPEIGPKVTELLIDAGYYDIDRLLELAEAGDAEPLTAIDGIGEKTAEAGHHRAAHRRSQSAPHPRPACRRAALCRRPARGRRRGRGQRAIRRAELVRYRQLHPVPAPPAGRGGDHGARRAHHHGRYLPYQLPVGRQGARRQAGKGATPRRPPWSRRRSSCACWRTFSRRDARRHELDDAAPAVDQPFGVLLRQCRGPAGRQAGHDLALEGAQDQRRR